MERSVDEETTAKEDRAESTERYDCGTCGDKGEVSILLETFLGKRLQPMPCPDCTSDPESKGRIRVESLRDKRLKEQDEKIRTVALVSLGTLIVVVLILFSIRDKLTDGTFAQAVKETVKETTE
jgi:hypothetical protein